ncbi:MAG: tyrosine-type recombinase/integrase [Candidatus Eisenbacteria bacterium]
MRYRKVEGLVRRGSVYYWRRTFRGREMWRSLRTEDAKEAHRLAVRLNAQFGGTANPMRKRLRLREAAAEWMEVYVQRARRNKKDRAAVAARMRDYILPQLGELFVDAIGPADVRDFALWLSGTGKALNTQAHILSNLRQLLAWCEESGHVGRSPFPRRVLPRMDDRLPERLSPDDEAKVAAVPGRLGFSARILLATGLRWGEFAAAHVRDVKFPAADHRDGLGEMVVPRGKGGKVRTVPIPPRMVAEIRREMPAIMRRGGRISPYSAGSPGAFSLGMRKASGVRGFHPHQTRHTYACRCLEAGLGIEMLAQILGHSDVRTTQRYARLSHEVVMREAARIAVGT